MEMKDGKAYLLWIREQVGKEYYIVVKNTPYYNSILAELKDPFIIYKEDYDRISNPSRLIKRN